MNTVELLLSSFFSVAGIITCIVFYFFSIPRCLGMIFSFIYVRKKKNSLSVAEPEEYPYCVLVCAHNEEQVIAGIVDSIKEQDYDPEKIRIYVMADNCDDRTAEIAEEHGATVFERHNLEKVGKGYALELMFNKLKEDEFAKECRGFFIFDADNVAAPDFVRQMNNTVCEGYDLCKGFRSSGNFSQNMLSMCHGLYFVNECETLDRGRLFMKNGCIMTGTGFYVSRKLMELEGGWHYFLMSEDTQITADALIKYGMKAGYNPDACFYDEQPTTWKTSFRQRKRWVFGTSQIFKEYGKDLLKYMFKNRSFTAFDIFSQCFMAGILTGSGMIFNMIAILLTLFMQGIATALISFAIYIFTLYIIFLIMGGFTFAVANSRIPLRTGKKIKLLFFFPIYMFTYVWLGVVILFTKDMKWKKIEHTGVKDKSVENELSVKR